MVEGIIEHTEGASHDEQDLPNWKSLEKEIENLKELCSEACIYKVHEGLRRTKPEAYTPLLISIGPYHHGDPKFSKMEKLKLRCLKSVLQRGEGVITMEQCWNKLKGSKENAKSYYVDLDDIKLSDNDFVKMLLLDGCFIVEFFVRRCQGGQKEERDPFFMPSGMKNQILLDLFLLENQLPFFVLQQVYDMIFHGNKVTLLTFFNIVMLNCVSIIDSTCSTPIAIKHLLQGLPIDGNAQDIKHLLQVVHILCDPQRSSNTQQERDHWTTCFPAACSCFSKHSQDSNNSIASLRTASELQEAGVHIKKSDNAPSLFHIKFDHGKLQIPSLHISDPTETFFRNIIAYEQHPCDVHVRKNMYFTDYCVFMDYLINTEKDVILFRKKGVFINDLGDDKEVTDLFNQLGQGVEYSSSDDDFSHADVCKKLHRHCNRPWNVLKAKLRHDYFHSPWAGVSTIAAILLLLLTIAQTVIALLDLLNG